MELLIIESNPGEYEMIENEIGNFILDWIRALIGDSRSTIKSERDVRMTYLEYCDTQPDMLFFCISVSIAELSENIKPRDNRELDSANERFVTHWCESIFDYGMKFGNCEWCTYYRQQFVENVKNPDNAIEIFVALCSVFDQLATVYSQLKRLNMK